MQGYHATIMAYGQTGSGKTYTMLGGAGAGGNPIEANHPGRAEFDPGDFSTAGIIPRAVDAIFREIENDTSPESKYLVRVSYLQIYNEVGNFTCVFGYSFIGFFCTACICKKNKLHYI